MHGEKPKSARARVGTGDKDGWPGKSVCPQSNSGATSENSNLAWWGVWPSCVCDCHNFATIANSIIKYDIRPFSDLGHRYNYTCTGIYSYHVPGR